MNVTRINAKFLVIYPARRAVAMNPTPPELDPIEARVIQLFALVSEALAGATEALLGNDASMGSAWSRATSRWTISPPKWN